MDGKSTMNDSSAIINSLRNELSLQKRHVNLLRAQNAALIACDRTQFFALFEGYSEFLAELETHASERNALRAGAESLAELTAGWPEEERQTLRKLSHDIQRALESARSISAQNQK